MINYFKFGDYSNREMGVYLTQSPSLPTPQERGEAVTIPGRSGNLWLGEGAYDELDFGLEIYIPQYRKDYLPNIRAWLSGAGLLCLEEGSLFDYQARVSGAYSLTPVGHRDGWQGTVPISCYPFRYLRNPANIELTASDKVINNPYTVYSEPLLTMYGGAGMATVTVGSTTFVIEDMLNILLVDTQLQECYNNANRYNHRMEGAFPILAPGDNLVTWTGSINRIVVSPRWRSI